MHKHSTTEEIEAIVEARINSSKEDKFTGY